jgi:hypothetical protein
VERRLPAGRSAGILPAWRSRKAGRLEAGVAAGKMPALRITSSPVAPERHQHEPLERYAVKAAARHTHSVCEFICCL